jgi:hypothetical protein
MVVTEHGLKLWQHKGPGTQRRVIGILQYHKLERGTLHIYCCQLGYKESRHGSVCINLFTLNMSALVGKVGTA